MAYSLSEARPLAGRHFVRHRRGSKIWLGDVARCLRENLNVVPARVRMVTITGPGADVLPCSIACAYRGPHAQRSKDGCMVDGDAAAAWNRSMPQRWTALHKHAQQRTLRKFGRRARTLTRVFQRQQRGVDHVHVVLADESEIDRIIATFYVQQVRDLGPDYLFGHVDDRNTSMERGRAAAYLSGYFTGGESSQLAKAVAADDAPKRPVWIRSELTLFTRCTMRNLRRARYLHMLRQDAALHRHAGALPKWFRNADEYDAIATLLNRWPTITARAP